MPLARGHFGPNGHARTVVTRSRGGKERPRGQGAPEGQGASRGARSEPSGKARAERQGASRGAALPDRTDMPARQCTRSRAGKERPRGARRARAAALSDRTDMPAQQCTRTPQRALEPRTQTAKARPSDKPFSDRTNMSTRETAQAHRASLHAPITTSPSHAIPQAPAAGHFGPNELARAAVRAHRAVLYGSIVTIPSPEHASSRAPKPQRRARAAGHFGPNEHVHPRDRACPPSVLHAPIATSPSHARAQRIARARPPAG